MTTSLPPNLPIGLIEDICDLFKDPSTGLWQIRIDFKDCFEKVVNGESVEYHLRFSFLYEVEIRNKETVEFRRYQINKSRFTPIVGLEEDFGWGTIVKCGPVRMILCWPKFGYIVKGLVSTAISFWFDDKVDRWVLSKGCY